MLRSVRLSVLGLGLAMVILMSGCSSNISSADIRSNPTPELLSQTLSVEEYRNDRAIHWGHARRTMYDDIARMFFFDKNTNLTPWPVP